MAMKTDQSLTPETIEIPGAQKPWHGLIVDLHRILTHLR